MFGVVDLENLEKKNKHKEIMINLFNGFFFAKINIMCVKICQGCLTMRVIRLIEFENLPLDRHCC